MKPVANKKRFWTFVIFRDLFIFAILGLLMLLLIVTFNTYREDYFVQINIEERNLQTTDPIEPNTSENILPTSNQDILIKKI